jgi:ribosome-binding protein aMBF1 (putative translation factor)
MTTKLNKPDVSEEYQDLFAFKNKEEEIEHKAQMISYRVLSEVEKVCEEKKINKKELATMVGFSPSYITQLFRGVKHVNMDVMARFEDALELCFEIKSRYNTESHSDFVLNQMCTLGASRYAHKKNVWYRLPDQDSQNQAVQAKIINAMATNDQNQQKAS